MNKKLLSSGGLLVTASQVFAQQVRVAGSKHSPALWLLLVALIVLLLALTIWLTQSINKRRENN